MVSRKMIASALTLSVLVGAAFVFNLPAAISYEASDRTAASVEPGIVEANNEFGLEMVRELSDDEGNVFISPVSISSSLLMAYNGASGETKETMARTLEIENMSREEVNSQYSKLLGSLTGVDRKVTLEVANSVWIHDDFEGHVNEEYRSDVTRNFDAGIFVKPFNQETANQMNSWVKQNTNGKIKELVDSFQPRERMFLVNAIYFKGDWSNKFDESNTDEEKFDSPSGKQKVQMMEQREDFRYYSDTEFKMVRLPYGREKVAMYVFLPQNDSLEEWLASTSMDEINDGIKSSTEREVQVKLPKFEMKYSQGLKEELRALGMGNAFSNTANFERMADKPLKISRVKHKTYVKVDEEGTEAAAITGTGMMMITSAPPRNLRFIADRPFFFIIRDDRTGAMLFAGKIVSP